jgi:hypothetical protein
MKLSPFRLFRVLALFIAIAPLAPSAAIAAPNHSTIHLSSAPIASQRRLQIFFPRYPDAMQDFTKVAPVWRTTSRSSLAQFAIEQLIAGPTKDEQQRGLRPAFQLRGAANCGRDFTIAVSNRVAYLRFCRQVVSKGIGDDARARTAIEQTLKQFPTIGSVVILNPDGSCFADQSGDDRCFSFNATER